MDVKAGLVAIAALIAGTATSYAQNGGWHFGSWSEGPIAAFTPQPNDACQRTEMKSAGMPSPQHITGRQSGALAVVAPGIGIQIAEFSSPNGFARPSSAHMPTQAHTIASSASSHAFSFTPLASNPNLGKATATPAISPSSKSTISSHC